MSLADAQANQQGPEDFNLSLPVSFDEVPNVSPPIEPGLMTLEIVEVKKELASSKDSTNVILNLKVTNEGPNQGRAMVYYCNSKMLTNLKRVCLSTGLDVAGKNNLDIRELKGRSGRAMVVKTVYDDKRTGKKKEGSQIDEWLIPGDPGFAVA